jgi:hypothetical protein
VLLLFRDTAAFPLQSLQNQSNPHGIVDLLLARGGRPTELEKRLSRRFIDRAPIISQCWIEQATIAQTNDDLGFVDRKFQQD